MQWLFLILIGLIGGAAVGLQTPISGMMGARIGGIASSFIIHLSGMMLSGLMLLLRGGERIREWSGLPWYMLISGIFGVVLFQTLTYTVPRIGGTLAIALMMIGQLIIGILIDHYGWLGVEVHPISLVRVAGVVLLIAGGYLISR
jgi:transporter family-2 protein